jgi:hypothetical protein
MLKIEPPSPMGNEEDWTIYINYLDSLDNIDEKVIAERVRAEKLLELIKEDNNIKKNLYLN